MTSFNAITTILSESHWEVRVYAGPDPEHRALTGRLTMTPDEAAAFVERVNGPDPALTAQYSYDQGYRSGRHDAINTPDA